MNVSSIVYGSVSWGEIPYLWVSALFWAYEAEKWSASSTLPVDGGRPGKTSSTGPRSGRRHSRWAQPLTIYVRTPAPHIHPPSEPTSASLFLTIFRPAAIHSESLREGSPRRPLYRWVFDVGRLLRSCERTALMYTHSLVPLRRS